MYLSRPWGFGGRCLEDGLELRALNFLFFLSIYLLVGSDSRDRRKVALLLCLAVIWLGGFGRFDAII